MDAEELAFIDSPGLSVTCSNNRPGGSPSIIEVHNYNIVY